jgi:hypothetical protein
MEKSNKRGKIPQADWPLIMARYDSGETLASIARTYDCSPPAISYVVSRSRARQPARDRAAAPSASEPQLIKSMPNENTGERPPAASPAADGGPDRPGDAALRAGDIGLHAAAPKPGNGRDADGPREGNGFFGDGLGERTAPVPPHAGASPEPRNGAARGAQPPAPAPRPAASPLSKGEPDSRHRLHLSLGGNGAAAHTGSPQLDLPPPARPVAARADTGPAAASLAYPAHARSGGPAGSEIAALRDESFPRSGNDGVQTGVQKGASSAFIDRELRARVDTDIAAFLAAFDAALMQDTQESRSALREATDRLLRAGARTRIELERLEARVPLAARDGSAGDPGAWRHR